MTIFIPLLFICINNHCEFLQATTHNVSEKECRVNVEKKKDDIRKLVREVRQGEIETLEGTCVELDIKKLKKGTSDSRLQEKISNPEIRLEK